MTKPTLVYFAARGRAEVIRLALAEAGVDYQEHPVGRGTPPANGRPTDFAALKASGDLPFEAVPVWEEPGGFRLAQSLAILSHVGRTHGLGGRTPIEAAQIDQWLGAVEDVRAELRKLTPMPQEQRAAFRAELRRGGSTGSSGRTATAPDSPWAMGRSSRTSRCTTSSS